MKWPDGLYRRNVPAYDEVREGSGFDKIFGALLSQGRPVRELIETHDRVPITASRRILKPEIIHFIGALEVLIQRGAVRCEGNNCWRRYGGQNSLSDKLHPIVDRWVIKLGDMSTSASWIKGFFTPQATNAGRSRPSTLPQ